MKRNLNKWVAGLSGLVLASSLFSCKDKQTLAGVGNDYYITITPSAPKLRAELDTIAMTCAVRNVDGEDIKDAVVSWSSEDEKIVKVIEGNKIVAVKGGEGKEVAIRASLQNGRYAKVTATVTKKANASGITFFLNEITPVKKYFYMPAGEKRDLLLAVTPAALIAEEEIEWSSQDDVFKVTKKVLDPEKDSDIIKDLPQGAAWYVVEAKPVPLGVYTLNVKLAGKTQSLSVKLGPTLKAAVVNKEIQPQLGLDPSFKSFEKSEAIDILTKHQVEVYADVTPNTQEALDQIKGDVVWEVSGGGGIIEQTESSIDPSGKFKFVAHVASGSTEGNFKVSCTLQEATVGVIFSVLNFKTIPFEGISFAPSVITGFSVGEHLPIRLLVTPRSSTAVILGELDLEKDVTYSTPGIVELQGNDGVFSLRALATGTTDMTITLRGKSFTLKNITTLASPKSLSIDNSTPNVLMVGDEVDWRAKLLMEGADKPDWTKVHWSIDKNVPLEFVTKNPVGEVVRLKALDLPSNQPVKVEVRAQYGKSDRMDKREMTIVPVQPSATLSNEMYETKQSGIRYSGGLYDIVLKAKDAQQSIPANFRVKVAGSDKFEEGVYTVGNGTEISVRWSIGGGLIKQAESGSISIEKDGSKYKIVVNDLTLDVAGKKIKFTGTVTGLARGK